MPTPIDIPGEFDFTLKVASDDSTVRASSFWIEQIDNISPSSEEFASKFGRAVLYAYVPDEATPFYNFINRTLGFAYIDGTSLKRVKPIRHPKHRNLHAARITDSRGVQYETRRVPAGITPATNPDEFGGYDRRLVAVEFAPCPFNLKDEDEITTSGAIQEWKRSVIYDVEPNIYDVTIQVGTFGWAEGTAGNPNGKTFPGEINFLEVKTTFNLVWKNVPEDYVLNTTSYDFGLPTKPLAAAGKVNSAAWAGYSEGVLLLLEPKIDRYQSGTLRSAVSGEPVYFCDVILPIVHFDPTTYGSDKGHNTKPWWNKADNTFKYHLVTSDGTASGGRIYGSYDFKKIFEHWSV